MRMIKENKLALAAVLIFAIAAVLAYHIHVSSDSFDHAYRAYAVSAETADLAVQVPTATNNPVRGEMNTLLIQILSKKMTDAERLSDAQRGLELISASKNQIDAISPKLDDLDAAQATMRSSTDFLSSFFSGGLPGKILSLAQERHAAISDIRAYSYRADFDTQKIFEHIVSAKGALSDSYVTELNSEIPAEETDFDARQNRYYDLQDISDAMKQDFAAFESRFSIGSSGK